MKKTLIAALAILCIAVFSYSCEKDPAPELTLTSLAEVTLADGMAGRTSVITFKTNRYWLVKTSDDWAHVEPYSGPESDMFSSVTVTFDQNPTNEPRTVVVSILAGGLTETVTITQPGVFHPVTSISLSATSAILKVGEQLQLLTKVSPRKATDPTVTWTVEPASDTQADQVTVSDNGLVTAVKPGYVYVVATSGECSAECLVCVVPENDTVFNIYCDLNWNIIRLYAWDEYYSAVYTSYPGMTETGSTEIQGRLFHTFSLNSKWFAGTFAFFINDGEALCTDGFCPGVTPGEEYYIYVTGPYDENNFAQMYFIEDISTFNPADYH